MNLLAVIFVSAIAGLGLFLYSKRSEATGGFIVSEAPQTLDQIFLKYGEFYDVDPMLLKAVAMQESSLNPAAVNKADNESIGLMQILCKPNGSGGCSNRFNVEGWETASRDKLLDADFNVSIGSQILAWNISQYGIRKGIAVYNNWSMRNAPAEGPFSNQSYVDSVLRKYAQLKG